MEKNNTKISSFVGLNKRNYGQGTMKLGYSNHALPNEQQN